MDSKFYTGLSYEDIILQLIQKNDKLHDNIRSLGKEIEENSIKIEFYKQIIVNGHSEYKIGEKINYTIFGDKIKKIGFISMVRLSSIGNMIYYITDENGKKIQTDTVLSIYKI